MIPGSPSLDLTALSTVSEGGSIFDAGLASRMERAMFLRSLSQRLTRPVMPDDQDFDYLPTQAIADFLATQNQPRIDGIMFPSVQVAGDALNVVLFYKAALVGTIELPEGTEIQTSTGEMYEEGWETEYTVIEEVPPKPASHETRSEDDGWPDLGDPFSGRWPRDHDSREPTLQIDIESIKVHVVRRVDFDTVEHDVRRYRWEKREPDF
jgi:hypothetical protein